VSRTINLGKHVSDDQTHNRRGLLWLVAGVIAGGLGTAALVMLIASAVKVEPPIAAAAPRYVREGDSLGIDHSYEGEFNFFVGGGVTAFDCSGDRLPDLFLAGGSGTARLYRNSSELGGPLRFSPADSAETQLRNVTGAYPIDIDSDGLIDLAVLRLGENVVLRGLGNCQFERANERWKVDGGRDWTASFSAQWEPDQIWPTLAFGNYVELSDDGETGEGCADSYLLRPATDGYGPPMPLSPGWCTLSILFSDWDRSGQRDLRITNDRHYYTNGDEQLWRIAPGEAPRLYTPEDGWQPMKIWGMGIASQDITNDGYPEVFLTSQGDNKLQTLVGPRGEPMYGDIALSRAANAHRPFAGDTDRPSTAWHAEFEDVNNDGLIDLFVAKGNVDAMPEFASADPNNLLLGQTDGRFLEAAELSGILDFSRSRGAAVVDFNLDGLLDLVVVERREPVKVWRNLGVSATGDEPTLNWVALAVSQKGANRDAIGSWIELKAGGVHIEREITIGGGHAGGKLGWIHFGLGTARKAKVRVRWPDGEAGPWMDLPVNRFMTIERGASQAVPWVQDSGP
jgi:hypothetical protein